MYLFFINRRKRRKKQEINVLFVLDSFYFGLIVGLDGTLVGTKLFNKYTLYIQYLHKYTDY
jgi:hypothetical protein